MGPRRWNKFSRDGYKSESPGTLYCGRHLPPLCFLFQVGRHASYQPYKSVLVWKWFSQKTIYLVGLCGNRVTWFNLIWKTENKFPHLSSSSSPHKIWPGIYNLFQTMNVNIWMNEWMNKISNMKTCTPQSSFTKTVLRFWKLLWKSRNWDSGDNLKLEIAEGARSRAPKTEWPMSQGGIW